MQDTSRIQIAMMPRAVNTFQDACYNGHVNATTEPSHKTAMYTHQRPVLLDDVITVFSSMTWWEKSKNVLRYAGKRSRLDMPNCASASGVCLPYTCQCGIARMQWRGQQRLYVPSSVQYPKCETPCFTLETIRSRNIQGYGGERALPASGLSVKRPS